MTEAAGSQCETYVGTTEDGQVMVTVWLDGTAELATRSDSNDRWGPPTKLRKVDG